MAKKQEVFFKTYKKRPRLLPEPMEKALSQGGELHPLLESVAECSRLRLDLRDHTFNIYYRGGSLVRVMGPRAPWKMKFDPHYFKDGAFHQFGLPKECLTAKDSADWVHRFPDLIKGMETWWEENPRPERSYCQAMADAANPEYIVLDLEYQFAKRQFDMVAAKRRQTKSDPEGWVEPTLAFVEVKCQYAACRGKSGLVEHASDYRDIVEACDGMCIAGIKDEFQQVVAQKKRLGLIDSAFPFRFFEPGSSELLLVLADIDQNDTKVVPLLRDPRVSPLLRKVEEIHNALPHNSSIRLFSAD